MAASPQELGERPGETPSLPLSLQKQQTLLVLKSQTANAQTCETAHFCGFNTFALQA